MGELRTGNPIVHTAGAVGPSKKRCRSSRSRVRPHRPTGCLQTLRRPRCRRAGVRPSGCRRSLPAGPRGMVPQGEQQGEQQALLPPQSESALPASFLKAGTRFGGVEAYCNAGRREVTDTVQSSEREGQRQQGVVTARVCGPFGLARGRVEALKLQAGPVSQAETLELPTFCALTPFQFRGPGIPVQGAWHPSPQRRRRPCTCGPLCPPLHLHQPHSSPPLLAPPSHPHGTVPKPSHISPHMRQIGNALIESIEGTDGVWPAAQAIQPPPHTHALDKGGSATGTCVGRGVVGVVTRPWMAHYGWHAHYSYGGSGLGGAVTARSAQGKEVSTARPRPANRACMQLEHPGGDQLIRCPVGRRRRGRFAPRPRGELDLGPQGPPSDGACWLGGGELRPAASLVCPRPGCLCCANVPALLPCMVPMVPAGAGCRVHAHGGGCWQGTASGH